jgi:hypothetical protein
MCVPAAQWLTYLHANMHVQLWRRPSYAAAAALTTACILARLSPAAPQHFMLFGHVMYTCCVRSCAQTRLSSNCSATSASTAPLPNTDSDSMQLLLLRPVSMCSALTQQQQQRILPNDLHHLSTAHPCTRITTCCCAAQRWAAAMKSRSNQQPQASHAAHTITAYDPQHL